MNGSQPPRRWFASFGALLGGAIVSIVLSIVADAVMHATGVFPPTGTPMPDALFVLATAYRAVCFVTGSFVTARLAPDRPMAHALVGGVIGVILGVIGAATTWNRGPEFGPHWYPLSLIALALPCAWAGAAPVSRSAS